MPKCALVSLRFFESFGLVMGLMAIYMSTNLLHYDMSWQDTLHKTVLTKDNVDVVEFISKNTNWEYLSCLMQAGILIICIGHIIFCQAQFTYVKQFAMFESICKSAAYISGVAAVSLLMSATYYDDKRYTHLIEIVVNARMKNFENKPHVEDPAFDFLCSNITTGIFNLSAVNTTALFEVTAAYTKYTAMFLLLVNCLLFGTMYNYAKSKKTQLERNDLANFVMERAPPAPAASCRLNMNRVIPVVAATIPQVVADLPPPYDVVVNSSETKVINETRVDDFHEVVEDLDMNNNLDSADPSESTTDADRIPPSYEFALLNANKK